jgi:hypothetical protein
MKALSEERTSNRLTSTKKSFTTLALSPLKASVSSPDKPAFENLIQDLLISPPEIKPELASLESRDLQWLELI